MGLFKDEVNERYGIVFQLPKHLFELPRQWMVTDMEDRLPSCLTKLFNRTSKGLLDLGLRFDAARKLVASLLVMHTCGWLHKNIRSDNIFFFPAKPPDRSGRIEGHRKDFGRPYIMGYGISRPDDIEDSHAITHISHGIQNITVRPRDEDQIMVDIYKHPDKLANPSSRFRHTYDIYSLGVVLLEIGLWHSLKGLRPWPSSSRRAADPYAYKDVLLEEYVPQLVGMCGSMYASVVRECLEMGDVKDSRAEDEAQRKLCWDLAEKLDRCCA